MATTLAGRRWAIAVHEAGHAVIPRKLGLCCGPVEIVGTTGSATTYASPVTMAAWALDPRRRHRTIEVAWRAWAMACQAGEEAELEIIGECPIRATRGDRRGIGGMLLMNLKTPPLEVFFLEHSLRRQTRLMVRRHRHLIEAVAVALLERGTLTGEEVDGLAL